MWIQLCALPTDVATIHVFSVLEFRDLVRLSTALVRGFDRCTPAMQPLAIERAVVCSASAIKWIFSRKIRVLTVSVDLICTDVDTDRLLQLIAKYYALIGNIELNNVAHDRVPARFVPIVRSCYLSVSKQAVHKNSLALSFQGLRELRTADYRDCSEDPWQ